MNGRYRVLIQGVLRQSADGAIVTTWCVKDVYVRICVLSKTTHGSQFDKSFFSYSLCHTFLSGTKKH